MDVLFVSSYNYFMSTVREMHNLALKMMKKVKGDQYFD